MTTASHVPIKLLSRAIERTEDDYYTYDQQAVLFPHEPIRRELIRGQKALEFLDVVKYPWKAKYLQTWLADMLIPVILDHHDAEETHMTPFYAKKGVRIPESMGGAHMKITKDLENIGLLADKLAESPSQENVAALKKVYDDMVEMMFEHFDDEERFWPEAIRSVGEEEYNVYHKEMHAGTRNQPSGHMFVMSALDSMGYEFDEVHRITEGDTRWCGDALLEDMIINKIPYFVRNWVFPPINRKYQHKKKLIETVIRGTEDNIPLKFDESGCVIC